MDPSIDVNITIAPSELIELERHVRLQQALIKAQFDDESIALTICQRVLDAAIAALKEKVRK